MCTFSLTSTSPVHHSSAPLDADRSSRPSLSAHIIIVSYHSNIDLRRCLPALAHTIGDCPVTIVDNAFPDEAIAWISREYPQWQILYNSANLGFGHANNLAAQGVTADCLVFLNPDTVPTDGWLEALLRVLSDDPQVGLTTSKIILLSEPNALNTAGNSVHLSGLTTCRGIRAPLTQFTTQERIGAVSGACFAIRRSVYESLGGFDEVFFLYMEDTDLSLRALITGQQIVYTPDSVVYHDYELSFNNRKVFYQERNRYLMLAKLFHRRTLLLLLPMLAIGELASWGFALTRERRSIRHKLDAYGWVIRHWQLLRMRRNAVQSERVISDHALLSHLDSRLDITQFGSTFPIRVVESSIAWISARYRRFLLRVIHW